MSALVAKSDRGLENWLMIHENCIRVRLTVVQGIINVSRLQKQPVEQKCNLQYASIQFSKKQADPLYSTINPAQAQKHKKEEEEENKIHYATVNFASASRAPR